MIRAKPTSWFAERSFFRTALGGTAKKVVVIAQGDKISEAEEAGADFAGGDDIVDKIKGGWLDFDALIATPDMMGKVGQLG